MARNSVFQFFPIVIAACLSASAAQAADTMLLWGDTHLHTAYSTDAYSGGNMTADPDTAFRYASGLPVIHPDVHTRVQIHRPLDFLVVADHADLLALQLFLDAEDPRLLESETGRKLLALHRANSGAVFGLIREETGAVTLDEMLALHKRIRMDPWRATIAAAEANNKPGTFTAIAGWEWSATPNGRNLHRVVFTDASSDILRQFYPFSSYDSMQPEDLWDWLEMESRKTGADFVAIPHNSNMSVGLMFDEVDSDGQPMSTQYARTRIRWEPVVEVTQTKGTSEVHPGLSPNDEFADFEIFHSLFSTRLQPTPDKADYVRSALKRGMEIGARTGVNPYKFGLLGGTDNHVGLVSTDEDDFQGATARNLTPAERLGSSGTFAPWGLSAAGLAGVWATENTREGIFNAVKRKEVYGTTGTRIALRVFGGFNFDAADADARDIAALGYSKGVPMGSDLTKAPGGKAPEFLILAVKDPAGANLDRVQVVKGWMDSDQKTHEHVYDVAWSGDRKAGADGKVPAVGNTVDLDRATYSNSIGAAQLATVWSDPDFDAAQQAFYYVRVLEIPTPRQQVFDAVALGVDPRTLSQPPSIQERAYSSPIWYTP